MSATETRRVAEALARLGWARWCDVNTIAAELQRELTKGRTDVVLNMDRAPLGVTS